MVTTDVIIHSDKVKTVPSVVGMAQCIRAHLLDDLSSIPRTHIEPSDLYTHAVGHAHPHTE